ncbi:uncharacterized protein LOC113374693 [Ctenocephalides felis]|uniref:uncharacterized protein LOC113374693 n=1 Tax=Ctenocephalides felis TaxID=7515 RepID=UPI000E6E1C08|nr:uncharacterized protein LOC113374693 [Ctenocephalides felis]
MSSASDYRKEVSVSTVRQRSLFTANAFAPGEVYRPALHHAEEPSSTSNFVKCYEVPTHGIGGEGLYAAAAMCSSSAAAASVSSATSLTAATSSFTSLQPLWQTPVARAGKCPTGLYPGDDLYPYYEKKEPSWRDPISEVALESNSPPLGLPNAQPSIALTGGATATPHGTISVRLRERIRVDLTIDKAVRVINFKNNIVLSLAGTGSAAALMHPNGRVYQYGSRVEILAHDVHNSNNRYAKMWHKGVSFTSDQCALVYLVDAAGTRTTTDSFTDMTQDFSLSVFYNESRHGPQYFQEALGLLQGSEYWYTDDGTDNYVINNVRISQTLDGLVRIRRNCNKCMIRTSPSNGSATLTTPFMHCTASMGHTSHLFVRRGERRMHFDGKSFIVRNAGHSAGFDEKNMLKVY